jgi:hypothetical protein
MATIAKTEVIATIKTMAAEGKTRDDVMMYMFQNGVKPSKMNGHIKEACVQFGRTGTGWRQATAKYFASTDTPTYDDWKVIMHNEGDVLLSENNQAAYTNHFKLWVSIKAGEEM